MYSPSVKKLIELFTKFPTVGPRTATRFVFYLMKRKKEEIEELTIALQNLKKNVKLCSLCFNPFEGKGDLCEICQNPGRDKTLLCIVEKETDLVVIEKTKKYKGLYFVLGGTVSRLRKEDIEKLRIRELEQRIKDHSEVQEIIIAINPTLDGEATALYLERMLKKNLPAGRQVTRLGRGLPVGGELEYADEQTLKDALEGRK